MKRLTLAQLRAYDLSRKNSCLVRKIEMAVDWAARDFRYAVQFWRDVELYGLDEAIKLLRPRADDVTEIEKLALKARRLIG